MHRYVLQVCTGTYRYIQVCTAGMYCRHVLRACTAGTDRHVERSKRDCLTLVLDSIPRQVERDEFGIAVGA